LPTATARDITFPSADGTPLKGWYWPGGDASGALVVAHGLGEHGGCYRRLAEELVETAGVGVLAFDMRGHGRSPGRRGVVRDYDELVADLRAALDWTARVVAGRPLFLLGHSNGGVVALRALAEGYAGLSGLVLSNPSLRLAVTVPAWKLRLGTWLRQRAPWVTLSAALPDEHLSRDPAVNAERRRDPLRHSRTSAPLFFGMVESGADLAARAEAVRVPTLLILGGADPVIDPRASEAFFDRLGAGDKALLVEPEMVHEPLHDLGAERVRAALAAWLRERMDADNRRHLDHVLASRPDPQPY
jgi:alpha-beta hydrolase superfamily lysophospholipase